MMPLLFIGHGSPMNAVQENDFTRRLKNISKNIEKPKIILVISAHWVTDGTFVTGAEYPKQIYDFSGFPAKLYQVKYSPKGSPETAREICNIDKTIPIDLDTCWGIDHGSWSILKHLYPEVDVPVIQLSIDGTKNEESNYLIGKKLLELRKKQVLIIGSGNIVHNLYRIDYDQFSESPYDWASAFDNQIKNDLENKNDDNLINFFYKNKSISREAVPTNEHYLPLLYIEALRQENEKLEYIYEGFQHKSISMRSFIIK